MCSENFIFVKYLKIRTFFKLPQIIHKPVKYGFVNKEEKKKKS